MSDANRYLPGSRYYGALVRTEVGADGRPVVYLARRLVPDHRREAPAATQVVPEGTRVDQLAAAMLGDPLQLWRLADMNGVIFPQELVEPVGRRVQVTLPEGISEGEDV